MVASAPSGETGEVDLTRGHRRGEARVDQQVHAVHVAPRLAPRNASTVATSRAVTSRPLPCSHVPVDQLVGHRLAEVVEQRRVDRRRAHAVGADAALSSSEREERIVYTCTQLLGEEVRLRPRGRGDVEPGQRLVPVASRSRTSVIMSSRRRPLAAGDRRGVHDRAALGDRGRAAPRTVAAARGSSPHHRRRRQRVGDAGVVEQRRRPDRRSRRPRRRPPWSDRSRLQERRRAGRSAALMSSTVTCAASSSARTSRSAGTDAGRAAGDDDALVLVAERVAHDDPSSGRGCQARVLRSCRAGTGSCGARGPCRSSG